MRTFASQGRAEELAEAQRRLRELDASHTSNFETKVQPQHVRKAVDGQPHARSVGGLAPPIPEKADPKVHGVNVQREARTRPQVGGARGRKAV